MFAPMKHPLTMNPMWLALAGLAALAALMPARALGQDWANLKCPDPKTIAQELMTLEVSGIRWIGAKESCLDQANFKYVKVGKPDPNEIKLIEKAVEDKPFEITEVKKREGPEYEARVTLYVDKGGKAMPVKTQFVFQAVEGPGKAYYGCGLVIFPPNRFAIKPSCMKADKR